LHLNFKTFGQQQAQPLLILHGLFGMLDNWQTLALQFAKHYHVFTIDQRNHGKSFHTSDFNYHLLSDDLFDFMHQHQINSAHIIGHSMGGKTAMQFAVDNPNMVEKLIIADIAPKDYPAGHDAIFDAFAALDLSQIQTRNEADEQMKLLVPDFGTRQFLLKNLPRHKNGAYGWKCNLPALQQHYPEILENSLTPYDQFEKPTLFIKGGNSERYIELPDDLETIFHFFPMADIQTIPDAGHWVHAEQPEAFYLLCMQFLQNKPSE